MKSMPSLPPATDGITLRNLLDHTSGLIDYEDLMGDDWQGQIRDAGVLQLLEREDRLYFPPGSAYRYSNGAYALLSLIVEKASGLPYPEFLRQRIFQPLGMHDTLAFVAGGPPVPHRAWGYSAAGSAPTRAPPARSWAMAASTPPSTTWRAGTRRCTTTACCPTNRAGLPSVRRPR